MLLLLSLALSSALAGDLAAGDTTTIEVDATSAYWHAGLELDEGCYEMELVAGTLYSAWDAWGYGGYFCDSDGTGCAFGYLNDVRMRAEIDYPGANTGTAASSADNSSTLLAFHVPGGYFETESIALGEASGWVEDFCLSAEQDVDFNVGDWGKWGDNKGGLTIELTRIILDEDDDGVDDDDDLCPGTDPGAVVDADGCSPEQAIELQCPSDIPWASHGDYVSCVVHAVNDLVAAGLLSNSEAAALKKAAARSSVGN